MTMRREWRAAAFAMLAGSLFGCAGDVTHGPTETGSPSPQATVVPNTPELQKLQAQTGVAIAALTDSQERAAVVAQAAHFARPLLATLSQAGCSIDAQRDAQTYRFISADGAPVVYVAFKSAQPCAGQPAQVVAAVDVTRQRAAAQVSYTSAQADGAQVRRFLQNANGSVDVRTVDVREIENEIRATLAAVQGQAAQCSTQGSGVGCSSSALHWGDCGLLEQLLTFTIAGAPGALVLYALLPGSTLLAALTFFVSGGLLFDTASSILRTCRPTTTA